MNRRRSPVDRPESISPIYHSMKFPCLGNRRVFPEHIAHMLGGEKWKPYSYDEEAPMPDGWRCSMKCPIDALVTSPSS